MTEASIALCSQKGGVGKTTLSLNLGLALSQLGVSATILELDAQGSLGSSLLRPHANHVGLAQVVAGEVPLAEARVTTKAAGLSLLPVGYVEPLERPQLDSLLAAGDAVAQVIAGLHGLGAEVVLVDCPSGLGQASLAALCSVSHVLLPVQAEPLSLRSVDQVLEVLERIREVSNPDLSLLGLVLCMFDRGSEASLSVAQAAWQSFDPRVVFETVVPRHDVFLDASLHGVPAAFMSRRGHPEGRRFQLLAQEILERLPAGEEEVTDGGPVQTLL